ncbi:Leucine rich repeat-containing protein [Eubacterium uniforme]|uniref:Leucine rich repeat-containing protein n=1 Tax=Eubacterium uniforme TaxID=39495 RepID=A0A1T4W4G5_9FIRM|nr:leucine-rich repeat protein [Eubacterium uniforme]SKA72123.1 Leucine rich repeat-containing protein [Eubacterium uniforme]
MRIKRRGLCISLACVMFVTIGPVGDYRSKIKAENIGSQIIDVDDEIVVPMIALSAEDGFVKLTEESDIKGIKLEDNVLTLDGYKGGSIHIDCSLYKIADLKVIVKGNNVINGNLLVNRTNIELSGKGILTINELGDEIKEEIVNDRNGVSICDGDLVIDGPRVIVNDSKEGVKVISTKTDGDEEETESITETESSSETVSETESETESQVEETSEEEFSVEETEELTEEETEESTEEETENSTEESTEKSTWKNFKVVKRNLNDKKEYAECKFTMKSGSLIVNMIQSEVSVNKDVVKHIYTQSVFAEKVFLDGGAIKVEYKDVDDSLGKINNEMSILSETKDGKAEGIILYSNYDLVQKDTRFIIITPRAYSGNVKLHSEFENVVVNPKKIVYLNSSDIKDLKVKLSEDKYTYDGNAKTPEVTIKGLIKDVDYKVSYTENVNPGKASVKVDGIDMFTGSVVVDFTIEKNEEVKAEETTPVQKPVKVTKKTKKKTKVYKAGYKFKDATFVYEIRKVGTRKKTGEVKIVGLRKKKVSKATIKGVVKYKKDRYKVTEIQKNAFSKLKKLEKVTIGKNVKFIGEGVLANCKNLKKVTFKTVIIKKIGMGAFAETPEEFIIKVPKTKFKKYRKLLKKAGYEGKIK